MQIYEYSFARIARVLFLITDKKKKGKESLKEGSLVLSIFLSSRDPIIPEIFRYL